MKAIISNFRSSRHRQSNNQMILVIEGVNSRKDAEKLIGKKSVFTTESGKEISGEITSTHGNKGAVRAIFERGMPGQSLAKEVMII